MNLEMPCSFALRWCDPLPQKTFANRFEWITSGTCRGEEFHSLGSYFFFIRRTKAEVLQGMPEKIREKIVFEVPEKERLEIAEKMSEMKKIKETQPKMFKVKYMEQYHDLPRIKAPFCKQYLEYLFTDGEMGTNPKLKCLLFAHHGEVMKRTLATVNEHKLKSIFINGETKERHSLVSDFQTNPETRVAVLSMTAAGTGLNLYAASLVIFLEMFPNPAILTQCEARAHRLGAKSDVVIRYLVAHETLDESLWRVVQRKENNQGLLLEGKNTPFKTDSASHVELKEEEENEVLEL